MAMLLLCLALFSSITPASCAAEPDGNAQTKSQEMEEAFDQAGGKDAYIGSQYRNNLYLDIGDAHFWDAIDKCLNGAANAVLSAIDFIGYHTASFYYLVSSLSLADLLGSQLDTLETALKTSVFDKLYWIAVAAALIGMCVKLYKCHFVGVMKDVARIIIIFLLSTLVMNYASTAISYTLETGRVVGQSVMVSLNSTNSETIGDVNLAAEQSAKLYENLVINPWLSLEFRNTKYTDDTAKKVLRQQVDSDERKEQIQSYMDEHEEEDPKIMSHTTAGERLGQACICLIMVILKCALYLFVLGMQIVYQAMAIFFVLLAPIVLLLAILPCFGINFIGTWLQKILETQIETIIVSFLLGVIVLIDNVLYGLAGDYGWWLVFVVEAVILAALVFNYRRLLGVLGWVGHMVRNPATVEERLRNADWNLEQNIAAAPGKVQQAYDSANDTAFEIRDSVTQRMRRIQAANAERYRNPQPLSVDQDSETVQPIRGETIVYARGQTVGQLPIQTADQNEKLWEANDNADAMVEKSEDFPEMIVVKGQETAADGNAPRNAESAETASRGYVRSSEAASYTGEEDLPNASVHDDPVAYVAACKAAQEQRETMDSDTEKHVEQQGELPMGSGEAFTIRAEENPAAPPTQPDVEPDTEPTPGSNSEPVEPVSPAAQKEGQKLSWDADSAGYEPERELLTIRERDIDTAAQYQPTLTAAEDHEDQAAQVYKIPSQPADGSESPTKANKRPPEAGGTEGQGKNTSGRKAPPAPEKTDNSGNDPRENTEDEDLQPIR